MKVEMFHEEKKVLFLREKIPFEGYFLDSRRLTTVIVEET